MALPHSNHLAKSLLPSLQIPQCVHKPIRPDLVLNYKVARITPEFKLMTKIVIIVFYLQILILVVLYSNKKKALKFTRIYT